MVTSQTGSALEGSYRFVKCAAIAMLLGDAIFIFLHGMLHYTTLLGNGRFSLELDGGYPELFQYAKQATISACFVAAFVRNRSGAYIGWALVFALLLVDDAAQGHEWLGKRIGEHAGWSGTAGLRPDDFGEIVVAAAAGLLVLVFSLLTLRRGSAAARQVTRDLLCLLALLAFFGVCVDALHVIAFYRLPQFSTELAIVEDGGEMAVMSATLVYVLALAMRHGVPAFDLWGWIGRRVARTFGRAPPDAD